MKKRYNWKKAYMQAVFNFNKIKAVDDQKVELLDKLDSLTLQFTAVLMERNQLKSANDNMRHSEAFLVEQRNEQNKIITRLNTKIAILMNQRDGIQRELNNLQVDLELKH